MQFLPIRHDEQPRRDDKVEGIAKLDGTAVTDFRAVNDDICEEVFAANPRGRGHMDKGYL